METNISYKLVLFFSSIDIQTFIKKSNLIEEPLRKITSGIELYRKGIIKKRGLEFNQIRKKKITLRALGNDINSIDTDGSLEVDYFIFDKSFSDLVQPNFFINLHFYNVTDLYFIDKNTEIKSFLLIGVDENLTDESLAGKFNKLFDGLDGKIGYFFEKANFYYDGKSDLAWAHQNILSKIKTYDVSKWHESGSPIGAGVG